jgi:hypothetical protein
MWENEYAQLSYVLRCLHVHFCDTNKQTSPPPSFVSTEHNDLPCHQDVPTCGDTCDKVGRFFAHLHSGVVLRSLFALFLKLHSSHFFSFFPRELLHLSLPVPFHSRWIAASIVAVAGVTWAAVETANKW